LIHLKAGLPVIMEKAGKNSQIESANHVR